MSSARRTKDVVEELFAGMQASVTSYGPGARQVTNRIAGTAFFPGGAGLWQGRNTRGPLPAEFPENTLMILGHNFDKVSSFDASVSRGIEKLSVGTWKYLLEYLEAAAVHPNRCFYSNVLVGLQPEASRGEMNASTSFYQECRDFLVKQISIIRPKAVATLGVTAAEQWHLSGWSTPAVALIHPSSIWCNRTAVERNTAIEQQGQLIRSVYS